MSRDMLTTEQAAELATGLLAPTATPLPMTTRRLMAWVLRAAPVVAAAERMTDDAFITTTDCNGMAADVQAAVRAYRREVQP